MNNSIDIKGHSNVVREQVIEINLADLQVEQGIDTVKVVVVAYPDQGRPIRRTLTIPANALESINKATRRGGF